jgi:chitodextrinase
MNKRETQAFIDSLIKLRDSLNDEIALTAVEVYPQWRANGEEYKVGQRVQYNGTLYKVLQNHNSQETWAPDVAYSLFAKVLIPDANVIPEWEQPESTNPYMKGDKVTYNGKTYVSTIDNNSWAPDVYGWEEYLNA